MASIVNIDACFMYLLCKGGWLMRKFITCMAFFLVAVAVLTGLHKHNLKVAMAANPVDIAALLCKNLNNLRAENGLNMLTEDNSLKEIADLRAEEAALKWSHERPNGNMGYELLQKNKWRGENLAFIDAKGLTADKINNKLFRDLCESPSHYANMTFAEYKRVGIGVYKTMDGEVYVAFIFTS